jgi:hypothetical protein
LNQPTTWGASHEQVIQTIDQIKQEGLLDAASGRCGSSVGSCQEGGQVMKILLVSFFQLMALSQIVLAVSITAKTGGLHVISIIAIAAATVAFGTAIEISRGK